MVQRKLGQMVLVLSVVLIVFQSARAADMKTLDLKYLKAGDSLKNSKKVASIILTHDQEVLQRAYTDLEPQFQKRGLTESDSATALVDAWYTLRFSNTIAPDVGLTMNNLDDFFSKVQPIVIDSAPRGAVVQLSPDGGYGPIKTRTTVLLKAGSQVKLHFSLPGFEDYESAITAGQGDSVVCRELQPVDPKTPRQTCPR